MKTRILLFFAFSLTLSASAQLDAGEPVDIEKYRAAATEKWEQQITEFETANEKESHPANSILLVGSSSFKIWDTVAVDMAPYHPINRGFGGSRWSDVAVFADRLITPHQFRAIVFFVGNDISGKPDDKTPEEVAALFTYVLAKVRAHNPTAPVFFIAVTATPKRWEAWPKTKAANTAAKAVCDNSENTYFIGTESIFLDAKGQPRPELFLKDQLHQNSEGYVRWAAAIKTHLDTVLDGAANP